MKKFLLVAWALVATMAMAEVQTVVLNPDCGDLVQLTAIPEEGYHFVRWSDGITDSLRTFVADRDSVLHAYFEINRYIVTVTVNDPTFGEASITPTSETYYHNQEVTVTAEPYECYAFVQWVDADDTSRVLSTDAEYTFNVTSEQHLMAVFRKITYTITVISDNVDEGLIGGKVNP